METFFGYFVGVVGIIMVIILFIGIWNAKGAIRYPVSSRYSMLLQKRLKLKKAYKKRLKK